MSNIKDISDSKLLQENTSEQILIWWVLTLQKIENNRLIVIDWLIVDKRPVLWISWIFYSPYTTSESHYREGCTPRETNYVLFLHPRISPGIIECALSLAAGKWLIIPRSSLDCHIVHIQRKSNNFVDRVMMYIIFLIKLKYHCFLVCIELI